MIRRCLATMMPHLTLSPGCLMTYIHLAPGLCFCDPIRIHTFDDASKPLA